jgi:chaperonin GroES
MALKPLNDRIIIEPSEAETRTASGLVLPDSAQEKPQRGKVLAVGPGKRLDNGSLVKPDVCVGDTVLYGKYSGTEVRLSGVDYVILRAEDVLGILVGGGGTTKSKPAAKSKPAPVKKLASKKAAPKKTASKAKPAKATPKKTAAKPKAAKPAPKAKKAVKKGKK